MNNRRHRGRPGTLWLVLTVVAMITGLGWVTTTQAQPSRPTSTVLIGRVTDADTGAPVAGAKVFVVGDGVGTSTRADGRYVLRDVPSSAKEIGFLRHCYRAVKVDLEPFSPRADRPIRVDIGLPSDASARRSGSTAPLGGCRESGGR